MTQGKKHPNKYLSENSKVSIADPAYYASYYKDTNHSAGEQSFANSQGHRFSIVLKFPVFLSVFFLLLVGITALFTGFFLHELIGKISFETSSLSTTIQLDFANSYPFTKIVTSLTLLGSLVFGYLWLKVRLENELNQKLDVWRMAPGSEEPELRE